MRRPPRGARRVKRADRDMRGAEIVARIAYRSRADRARIARHEHGVGMALAWRWHGTRAWEN
eukprot:5358782-Lingulodinium_polyedra.AAC.1